MEWARAHFLCFKGHRQLNCGSSTHGEAAADIRHS